MTLVLLGMLALADPTAPIDDTEPNPEQTVPTERPDSSRTTAGLPGTVDKPLRVRITKSTVEGAGQTILREWDKVESALLGLQASLYGESDRQSRSVGVEPGKPIRVRVDRDLHVQVEVLEEHPDWRKLRLRVEDEAGELLEGVDRATVQPEGGEETELVFAKPGEIVIENLESGPQTAVRLYMEEEAILIWLEE